MPCTTIFLLPTGLLLLTSLSCSYCMTSLLPKIRRHRLHSTTVSSLSLPVSEEDFKDNVAVRTSASVVQLTNVMGLNLLGEISAGSSESHGLVDFALGAPVSFLYDGDVFIDGFYAPSQSKTFVNRSKPFADSDYGIQGFWASDIFKVGAFQIPKQSFVLVEWATSGPFGSAQQSLALGSAISRNSFLERIGLLLDRRMFSIWTEAAPPFTEQASASITFGRVDSHCEFGNASFFTPQLDRNLTYDSAWGVRLNSLTFEGPTGRLQSVPVNRTAILTAMHGIYGPLKFIQPIADFVNATEHDDYFSFDCRKKVHLPLIHLNMDGGAVLLRPEQYSYENKLDKRCYLSFVPNEWVQTPVSAEFWFGTQVFDNYCMVIDYDHHRVGFAQKQVHSVKHVIP